MRDNSVVDTSFENGVSHSQNVLFRFGDMTHVARFCLLMSLTNKIKSEEQTQFTCSKKNSYDWSLLVIFGAGFS